MFTVSLILVVCCLLYLPVTFPVYLIYPLFTVSTYLVPLSKLSTCSLLCVPTLSTCYLLLSTLSTCSLLFPSRNTVSLLSLYTHPIFKPAVKTHYIRLKSLISTLKRVTYELQMTVETPSYFPLRLYTIMAFEVRR